MSKRSVTVTVAVLTSAWSLLALGAGTATAQQVVAASEPAAPMAAPTTAAAPAATVAASTAAPADTKVANLTSSAPAAGRSPLFTEDFSFADAGWSLVDAQIANGMLIHSPKPEHWSNAFYFGSLFKDADVRVQARIMQSTDKTATASSLSFWHSDGKNYYAFTFWHDSGFMRVTRIQDGNSIAVVERTIDKFKAPPDGWVDMRVVTSGNVATIYIGGVEQGKFKGVAPQQGWKVGMFASAPKTGSAQVAFRNLVVY